jgi:two-component system, chemotaxis family, sensor kinase CheA
MDEFELELKAAFLDEAAQLLADTEQCFLSLEASPEDSGIIDKIFRLAHNLKGSSKAVGFDQMGAFAHEFESLLLKIKNGEIKANLGVVSLLLLCNDHIREMVDGLKADLTAVFDSQALLGQIHNAMTGISDSPAAMPETEVEGNHESAEVNGDEFAESSENSEQNFEAQHTEAAFSDRNFTDDNFSDNNFTDNNFTDDFNLNSQKPEESVPGNFLDAGDTQEKSVEQNVLTKSLDSIPSPAKNSETKVPLKAGASDESIRVSLARLETLLNFVGEVVILQTVLKEQTQNSSDFIRKTVNHISKVTKEVQDIAMSLRMVPLKQTFQKMQRIVRDTSSSLGKKVNFIIEGDDTEVDKTVLESINDPLVHLVRNAVDHGVEDNAKRLANGKSEVGTIVLRAYHQSGKLVIEVKDDGGGIDPMVLRNKAVEKGIIHANAELSRQEMLQLVFAPGFSTKAVVTDVSGRGVGMDVVRTNIEALQGEVLIDTEIGLGTTFKVVLPLTLAIIEAMVVTCDEHRFVIPLSHVYESVPVTDKEVHSATGFGEILLLRGENLPLLKLSQLLGKKPKDAKKGGIGLVIRNGHQPYAIIVDDILGQQQVVVKKLGNEVSGLKGFSGSAILGDGKPALILDLSELVTTGSGTKKANESRRLAV